MSYLQLKIKRDKSVWSRVAPSGALCAFSKLLEACPSLGKSRTRGISRISRGPLTSVTRTVDHYKYNNTHTHIVIATIICKTIQGIFRTQVSLIVLLSSNKLTLYSVLGWCSVISSPALLDPSPFHLRKQQQQTMRVYYIALFITYATLLLVTTHNIIQHG